ncbi:MAG: FlgD immunoglobulin-like domain containing protein [bacterium]
MAQAVACPDGNRQVVEWLRRGALRCAVLALFVIVNPGAPSASGPQRPLLLTQLWNNPEPKDFEPASRFDAVEFQWNDIVRVPGYVDSVYAMKARNPNLKVIGVVSCDVNCTNWSGRADAMPEWNDLMAANDAAWYLRDTDGDYWKRADFETTCAEGWMNWTRTDMTVAFADYLYDRIFVSYPGAFDGLHFDHLLSGISWATSTRWVAGGIDSIDADRDGIADRADSLDARWKAGTIAFCNRMRERCGEDFILFPNGSVPPSVKGTMNGRFHEGFPGPVGGTAPNWYVSMFDPQIGYLMEPALYRTTPQQMITLQGLSFWPVNCDPQFLSTTEAPYDAECMKPIINLTLASALLGEGYACVTGFGRLNGGAGPTEPYHSTWWFPLYDTLRVNFGEPTSAVYDTLAPYAWQTTWVRQYEGGAVRITYPGGLNTAVARFEFLPKVVFREELDGASWFIGDTTTVRYAAWDPYAPETIESVTMLLSRDGGASYAETLGTFPAADSLSVVAFSGAASAACRVRLVARDTDGHAGVSESGEFSILACATSAVAELVPNEIAAGEAAPLTLSFLAGATPGGVTQLSIVRPSTVEWWDVTQITVNGGAFDGSIASVADTLRVTPGVPWPQGVRVVIAFSAVAQTSLSLPGAPAAVGFRCVSTAAWLGASAGNANGVSDDANSLVFGVPAGPLDHLVVTPPATTMTEGEIDQFFAAGRDAYENPVPVTPQWGVGGGIGTIDSAGFFLAMLPGDGAVIATAGAIRDSADVTVVNSSVIHVLVRPRSATMPLSATLQFSATSYDANNEIVPNQHYWSVRGNGGTIDSAGLFTATRTGYTRVYVWGGGEDDSALVFVIPAAVDTPEPSDTEASPRELALYQPNPNPTTGRTTIRFAVPANTDGAARLRVYDTSGRLVDELWNAPAAGGVHEVAWEGRDARGVRVSPGVYLLRLETRGAERMAKLVFLE